jgi:hypothetical protein
MSRVATEAMAQLVEMAQLAYQVSLEEMVDAELQGETLEMVEMLKYMLMHQISTSSNL